MSSSQYLRLVPLKTRKSQWLHIRMIWFDDRNQRFQNKMSILSTRILIQQFGNCTETIEKIMFEKRVLQHKVSGVNKTECRFSFDFSWESNISFCESFGCISFIGKQISIFLPTKISWLPTNASFSRNEIINVQISHKLNFVLSLPGIQARFLPKQVSIFLRHGLDQRFWFSKWFFEVLDLCKLTLILYMFDASFC